METQLMFFFSLLWSMKHFTYFLCYDIAYKAKKYHLKYLPRFLTHVCYKQVWFAPLLIGYICTLFIQYMYTLSYIIVNVKDIWSLRKPDIKLSNLIIKTITKVNFYLLRMICSFLNALYVICFLRWLFSFLY